MAKHTVREEFTGVLAFVGCIWLVFIVSWLLPALDLNSYGITPRTLRGLTGIAAAPFLHANLSHLISNTIPLTILLLFLAGSSARSWLVVICIMIVGGATLWLFGRSATHIGASGLIYGLIAYLIVSGILERRFVSIAISIIVSVLYGGTLASGVLPSLSSHISWEGHLFGAISGVATAFLLAPHRGSTNLLSEQ
jgi:membrane associated rhomboid family serine protease